MDAKRRSRAVMAIQWLMSGGLTAVAVTFPGVTVLRTVRASAGGRGASGSSGAAPEVGARRDAVHSVDLMTAEGTAVFRGQWRNMDAKIVEAPPRPNAAPWKVSLRPSAQGGRGGL